MTFKTLIYDLSRDAGMNADSTLGTVTVNAAQLELLRYFLSEAARWAWVDYYLGFVHPDTVDSGTLTPTGRAIAPASYASSTWLSLWTLDPRTDTSAKRVAFDQDSAGVYVDVATAYGFWQRAVPEFSVTAVVPATTYAAGAVVWDPDGTGHCYKALVSALGSALADTSKWRVQEVPSSLAPSIRFFARWKWLASKNLDQDANAAYAAARNTIDDEIERVNQRRTPPWLLIT